MKLPQRKQKAWVLIQALREHGPVNMKRGVELHGELGSNWRATVKVYDAAVLKGWIKLSNGKYALTKELSTWLKSLESPPPVTRPEPAAPIVLPAYHPPFKPLSKALTQPHPRLRDTSEKQHIYMNTKSVCGLKK